MANAVTGKTARRRRRTRRKRFIVGRPMRSGWRPALVRVSTVGLAPALLVGAIVGGIAHVRMAAPAVAATVTAETPYTFSGRGHGHGRGMGQWGAYGYASKYGWSAERILGYFYGGTTLGTIDDRKVGVRLMGRDDKPLDVFSEAGLTVAGRRVAPGEAAHLTPTPGGGANVVVTKGCAGEVLWQAATDHPWADPVDPGPDRPVNEHLKLCEGNVPYRGSLGTVLDGEAPRSIDYVHLEDYLLSVVPAESIAKWADTGGAEALRAQAVAARSYGAAENRAKYAQTCDTQSCQVYTGSAGEDPRTTEAVRSTRGIVLMRDGRVVPAEFSASTGGYSTGGDFPSVEDLGDSVAPSHTWAQTVTAGEIAKAFGIGELRAIEVTGRNNLGADGGRVTGVKVVGSDRTVETTGAEVRAKLKLKSDWFTVAEGVQAPPLPAQPGPEPGTPPGPGPGIPPVPKPRTEQVVDPSGTTPGSPIDEKFRELGGLNSPLGAPIGPELALPDEVGKFRIYTGGTILWTPGLGAQVIDANIARDWLPGAGGAE